MPRPLPVFGPILQLAQSAAGPRSVRVFERGRFLYASFDFGREQVMDIRAHDRMDLLQYWVEWMKPAPTSSATTHQRTPERARPQASHDDTPGEYLTSLGPSRRRMTLEEFLRA